MAGQARSDGPAAIGDVLDRFPALRRALDTPAPTPDPAAEARKAAARRLVCREAFVQQLGKRHAGATFANYRCDCDAQRELLGRLRRYVAEAPAQLAAGNGIVLFGACGSGKDYGLAATAAAILERHAVNVAWRFGPDLFAEWRDAIGSDRGETERDMLGRLVKPDVLILSDPLPPRGGLTEYQASMLARVVDGRWRDRRPTWVSLNVANGQEADERLSPAIVDRLRDGALCFACSWPSYRTAARWGEGAA